MNAQAWRTDEPCPDCGHGLYLTEEPDDTQAEWDCRTCGWSARWQTTTCLDDGLTGPGQQLAALQPPRYGAAEPARGQRGADAA